MRLIERLSPSDRQADTVDRDRIARPNVGKQPMRRTTVAHVVLGVHFEKIHPASAHSDAGRVLPFETRASQSRMESQERGCIVPIYLVHGASLGLDGPDIGENAGP